MAKSCCVCGETKESADNRLFTCKGHGCDVTVHQACYGIVSVPSGQWFCRKCESQERAARVRCELCPRKEGALKRTDSAGWAHVVCALYIPEVTFGNTMKMEPIITSKLPRERFSKSCYLCEEQGLENQSTHGACMSCHKSSCRLAFHVTCAQKEHLLCEEEDPRDQRNIIYCGYCNVHFKKMIRQKYKQSLRKVTATTPTTSTTMAPLLPLAASSIPPPRPSLSPPPPPSTTSLLSRDSPHPKYKAKEKTGERDGDLPLKRVSVDAPIPPAKRRPRKRKLSSSNESTASDAPSTASDIHQPLIGGATMAISPPSTGLGRLASTPPGPVSMVMGTVPMVMNQREQPTPEAMVLGSGIAKAEHVSVSRPLSPMAAGLGSVAPSAIAVTARQCSSSGSDQSLAARAQIPPLSLHELLERQWEQTAKLILDQAGKQNNAGVMLAHLHELQSENRRMQSRIMELASQREFYIATNTRLRLTLSENDVNRLPNGVQPPVDGMQQALRNNPISSTSESSVPDGFMGTSAGPGLTSQQALQGHQAVLSSSLPKAAQDSLLHAHFLTSSLQYPYSTSLLQPTATTASSLHNHGGWSSRHSHTTSAQPPEGTSSAVGSTHLPGDVHDTDLPLSASSAVDMSDRTGGGVHDVTQVTNSVQAPIAAHSPLQTYRLHTLPQDTRHNRPGTTYGSSRTVKEGR